MAIHGEYWWVRRHGSGLDWARCVAGEHSPREEGSSPDWPDLPAPAGARLVVCVPGERVRIHNVSIPARRHSRFMAALPFALEDQLLHEPEHYHFVPLRKPGSVEGTPVAVIEHEYMQSLLAETAKHDWRPVLLVPEFLAIAAPAEGVWFVDATGDPMLLRKPRGQGGGALAGRPDSRLPGTLLLALERAQSPGKLQVRVSDHDQYERVAEWRTRLSEYGIELDISEDDLSRAAWLARQPLPESGCNLLAGPYAASGDIKKRFRRLATVTGLAAAIVVVAGVEWFVEGSRIHSQHEQLQQQIEMTYREAFPDARNLVDPRYQMEQRLQALQERRHENSDHADLLAWLEDLAPVFASDNNTVIRTLGFDGRNLTLEVSVPDYDALQSLQDQLLRRAGSVDVENAELNDGRVHGRLRIRGRT